MNYNEKSETYFENVRHDLLSLGEFGNNSKVLEIGAGYGSTLSFLKDQFAQLEAVGVDIVENKNQKNIDAFYCFNIEKQKLPGYNNHFNTIIFADVLEHLYNPKKVLKESKKHLLNNGEILVSIPNIRNLKSMIKVFFKGDFSYEESGVFDHTHVRFYCKRNIINLVEESGYKIEKITSAFNVLKSKSKVRIINKLTFGIFEQFLTVQYLIKATKNE